MEEILFLELTKRGSRDKVLVCLPFDHAEARTDEVYPGRTHTHIRTKGGVDLYVAEPLADIKAMMAALAEHVANPPWPSSSPEPLTECPRTIFPDGTRCGDYDFHGLGCPERQQ